MGEREGGDLGQICIIHKRKKYFAIHISKICDSVSGAGFLRLVNCETNVKTSLYSRTCTKKTVAVFNFRPRASAFKHQGILTILNRVHACFYTKTMFVTICTKRFQNRDAVSVLNLFYPYHFTPGFLQSDLNAAGNKSSRKYISIDQWPI